MLIQNLGADLVKGSLYSLDLTDNVDAVGVFFNHPFLYEVPLGDTVLIPASDGYCVLSFFPFDTFEGEQRYLYGEYSLDVEAPGTTFDFTLIPIGAVDTEYAQRDTFTVEIRAAAEGSESVTFTGPRGQALTREIRTAVAMGAAHGPGRHSRGPRPSPPGTAPLSPPPASDKGGRPPVDKWGQTSVVAAVRRTSATAHRTRTAQSAR